MHRCVIAAAAAVVLFACAGSAVSTDATVEELPVAELWSQALQKTGLEYMDVRAEILGRGPEAVSFLEEKLTEEDWHSRMLAQALIERIRDPDQYRYYEELLVVPIRWAGMNVLPAYEVLPRMARGMRRGRLPGDGPPPTPKGGLHELEAVPFLAELLLKRSVPQQPNISDELPKEAPEKLYTIEEVAEALNVTVKTAQYWVEELYLLPVRRGPDGGLLVGQEGLQEFARRNYIAEEYRSREESQLAYSALARSYGAGVLGTLDHPLVVPVLIEVLESDDYMEAKYGAKWGLALAKSWGTLGQLVSSLEHEDATVRAAAAEALRRIKDRAAAWPLTEDMRLFSSIAGRFLRLHGETLSAQRTGEAAIRQLLQQWEQLAAEVLELGPECRRMYAFCLEQMGDLRVTLGEMEKARGRYEEAQTVLSALPENSKDMARLAQKLLRLAEPEGEQQQGAGAEDPPGLLAPGQNLSRRATNSSSIAMKFSYLVFMAMEWLGPRMNPPPGAPRSMAVRTAVRISAGVPSIKSSTGIPPQKHKLSPNISFRRPTSIPAVV